MSITTDTASCEIRLLRRGANNAIQKARGKLDLATLTAPAIEDVRKEVEPLIGLLDECVTVHIENFTDMEGDFSDDIEDWENKLEAIKIVWEHCLEKWRGQLDKNKKMLEAEVDAGESDHLDEVDDSSDGSVAELSEVELDNLFTPPLRISLYLVAAHPPP